VIALGYALGRVGCLAAGCCYGTFTTLPWGITFPAGVEAPAGVSIHPTQIYSSLWELMNLGVLLFAERRGKLKSPGQIFGLWLVIHGVGRALVEQFRGDFRGPEPFNLSISTWLSGAAIVIGVWMVSTAPRLKTETASAKAEA
jgi:phosphatidylglycerol---prolipoprotein diacylglyceryl transferase